MKKHLVNILIALIFLAGLSVLLYPSVSNYVNSKSQSRAIASYVENMQTMDSSNCEALLEEARAYNAALEPGLARFGMKEQALEDYCHLLGANGGAVGYIEINAIGVKLPIYLGDSPAVLQVGAGTMPGSSLPVGGPGTHSVLTGHRGLPSSKLFTDLDQLKVGDTFVLTVLNQTMTYEIDQIRIVLPQELSDLEIQEGKDFCTLVTCTPYGINSHRMLVRGTRVENQEISEEKTYHVTSDAVRVDPLLAAPVVAAPFLLAMVLFLLLSKPPKDEEDQ